MIEGNRRKDRDFVFSEKPMHIKGSDEQHDFKNTRKVPVLRTETVKTFYYNLRGFLCWFVCPLSHITDAWAYWAENIFKNQKEKERDLDMVMLTLLRACLHNSGL